MSRQVKKWMEMHKIQLIIIAVIILIAIIAIAGFTLSKTDEKNTADMNIRITADKGWDEGSTPAIIHIAGENKENADIYYAVYPAKGKNEGTETITIEPGRYDIDVISPVNSDGSVYKISEKEGTEIDIKEDTEKVYTEFGLTLIEPDDVTEDMLKEIASDIETSVGDDSIKNSDGKEILSLLAENIKKNPNISDEIKDDIVKDAEDAEKTYSENGGSASDTGTSDSSPASDSQTSSAGHKHSWKKHTAKKWVSNIVTVPDYSTQKVAVGNKYIFAYDGYATTDINDAKAHAKELILAGLPDNYRTEAIYEEKQVQVGSHKEDHGHYETYIDYYYCDCGARK